MNARKDNLFSESIPFAEWRSSGAMIQRHIGMHASLGNAVLIKATLEKGAAEASALAAEAKRCCFVVALSALKRMFRQPIGFGFGRSVSKQPAVVKAFALVGGVPARYATVPTSPASLTGLTGAISFPRSRCRRATGRSLPVDVLLDLLRHSVSDT